MALFQPMTLQDIPWVIELEVRSFPAPGLRRCTATNCSATLWPAYWAMRPGRELLPPILAYGGYWLMAEEAHILTIAVHPDHRRQGLGHRLLGEMMARAHAAGAVEITLEATFRQHACSGIVSPDGICGGGPAQTLLC
jgi:ribosomal-protein-alanine N-acetyltransferase